MEDILNKLDGGEFVGLVAVVLGIATGAAVMLTAIVTEANRKARKVEAEAQLKRDLVAAGFSPDDILRVVAAGPAAAKAAKAGCCGRSERMAKV